MAIYIDAKSENMKQEAAACDKIIDELHRILAKYERKVAKEKDKKKAELQAAMEYGSIDDIHDAYGIGGITEEEYYRLTDLFEAGEAAIESGKPTKNERICSIISAIIRDVYADANDAKGA